VNNGGRHYRNPPVVEALAELYFAGGEWDLTVPGSFYERIKGRFPQKGQMDQLAVELEMGREGARTRTMPGAPRSRFRSEDGSRMVQLGPDVLVVNQLRPYPHFEAWSPVLLEMLALYRELVRPTTIARLGVRYINRIVIPKPRVKMEEYFRIYAEVPPELGAAHGDFLLRLELPPQYAGHQLLLTFATAPPEGPGQIAYLLDLYDIVAMETPEAFDTVEGRLVEAHDSIEWVFENAITDATRELFGEVTDDHG
jgi:uncharacterized protein (TIGR04255 family)